MFVVIAGPIMTVSIMVTTHVSMLMAMTRKWSTPHTHPIKIYQKRSKLESKAKVAKEAEDSVQVVTGSGGRV
jgi:hypothetical protein